MGNNRSHMKEVSITVDELLHATSAENNENNELRSSYSRDESQSKEHLELGKEQSGQKTNDVGPTQSTNGSNHEEMPKTYDEFDKNHIFPFHFYPDQQKPEEVPPVPLYLMNEHARVPVRGRRSEPYVIQDQVNASREWFHATLQVRREQSLSHLHCPVSMQLLEPIMLNHFVSIEELDSMFRTFARWDKNGDAMLDLAEFKSVFRFYSSSDEMMSNGLSASNSWRILRPERIFDMMNSTQLNKENRYTVTGGVRYMDFRTFVTGTFNVCAFNIKQVVNLCFVAYDEHGRGFIDMQKLQSLLQLILEFNNSSIHVDLKKNRSYYRGRSNSYPVENFDSVQVKDLEPGQSVYLIQGIENIVKPQKRKSGFQRALGHLNTTIKAASGKFGRIDFKGFKKIVQNHPILLLPFVSFQQRLRSEVMGIDWWQSHERIVHGSDFTDKSKGILSKVVKDKIVPTRFSLPIDVRPTSEYVDASIGWEEQLYLEIEAAEKRDKKRKERALRRHSESSAQKRKETEIHTKSSQTEEAHNHEAEYIEHTQCIDIPGPPVPSVSSAPKPDAQAPSGSNARNMLLRVNKAEKLEPLSPSSNQASSYGQNGQNGVHIQHTAIPVVLPHISAQKNSMSHMRRVPSKPEIAGNAEDDMHVAPNILELEEEDEDHYNMYKHFTGNRRHQSEDANSHAELSQDELEEEKNRKEPSSSIDVNTMWYDMLASGLAQSPRKLKAQLRMLDSSYTL